MKKRSFTGAGNTHFITFSCSARRQLLNSPNPRQIVISVLAQLVEKGQVQVSGFVIMPDHVHALLWFDNGDSSLPTVMKTWKRLSSHYLIEYHRDHSPDIIPYLQHQHDGKTVTSIWHHHYYDFALRSHEKAAEKLRYIHENPVRKGLAERPEDYLWSSAPWYILRRSVGVTINPGF